MAAPPEPLEVARADRKLWLIKVPNFVGQVWKTAIQSNQTNAPKDLEDDSVPSLGRVTIHKDGSSIFLDLPDVPEMQHLPKRFKLEAKAESTAALDVGVISVAEDPKAEQVPRVEGTITNRFDLVPIQSATDDKGGVEIDAAYRAFARSRTQASMRKVHTVQALVDQREVRMAMLPTAHMAVGRSSKQQAEMRQSRIENKRTRIERDDLEKLLFALFERQPHWAFGQLQRETNQPGPWLKEVLAEVAVHNKKGPYKDLYELKKEYRNPASASAPDAHAQES